MVCSRIGFAIAQRLAEDGAKVMLSSRKQSNVDRAVKSLKDKGLTMSGMVCHVARKEQRQKMIERVRHLGLFMGLRKTKVQTSLRICAA